MDYFSLFIGFMLVAVGAIFFGFPLGTVLEQRRSAKRETFVDYKEYCTKCREYVPDVLESEEIY